VHRGEAEIVGGRGRDGDALARGQIDEMALSDEREQLVNDPLSRRRHLTPFGVVVQHVAPYLEGRPARINP